VNLMMNGTRNLIRRLVLAVFLVFFNLGGSETSETGNLIFNSVGVVTSITELVYCNTMIF